MNKSVYRIESELRQNNDKTIQINCESGRNVKPSDDVDKRVLATVETALSESFLQLFYQYPNIRDGDEKIDIVAVSSNLGVRTISVFDFKIGEITEINNSQWILEDNKSVAAIRKARSAEQSLEQQFNERDELLEDGFNPELRVSVNGFIALPNIDQKEFIEQFDLPSEVIDRMIFSDQIDSPSRLRNNLIIEEESTLSDEDLRHVLAVLKFSSLLSGNQLNAIKKPQTKGEVAETIQGRLKCITDEQFRIGLEHPDAPQRIRGIAGSGKTVVMALRAAYIHYQEDWDICVTFRNHGLYQTHRKLITKFYEVLSGGESPDWGNSLTLAHGWGNSDRDGLYRILANENGGEFIDSNEASRRFQEGNPAIKLEKVCNHLLKTTNIEPQYDAIIIDEAQDFTPSFFQLCREAVTKEQRLYWAGDEAQNLSTLEARPLTTLFGTDEDGNLDLVANVAKGFIAGGSQGTHVMSRSFRTPRSILMTAHAFGMGLYRDEPIRIINHQEQWQRLGYEVTKGDFSYENVGKQVQLKRPAYNSPHPLTQVESDRDNDIYPLLETYWGDSAEQEAKWIAEKIDRDLESGLTKDDIMIIYFWPPSDRDQAKRTLYEAIRKHCSSIEDNHNEIHHVGQQDRSKFREPGKISLSQVHYARGNESPVVYLTGLEYISESGYKDYMKSNTNWHDQYLGARNEAFVGISRTLAWCRISGHGEHDAAYDELNEIYADTDSHQPSLNFPTPKITPGNRGNSLMQTQETFKDY